MSRFKTELCNNLIELGICKYGDRCHYAHGSHELRQVSRRHPKYRTEKCKNFELTGKCPFGPRCSYVHPKPDLDSMIEQLSKYMQHTKAPRPDLEDDAENMNFFTRTNTSTSTCNSIATSITNNEENKENQRIIQSQDSRDKLFNTHHLFVDYHTNHRHNNHPFSNNENANPQIKNHPSLSPAQKATSFSFSVNTTNANVSSQALNTSSIRTPLGSNHSHNILTPINISNNFLANVGEGHREKEAQF